MAIYDAHAETVYQRKRKPKKTQTGSAFSGFLIIFFVATFYIGLLIGSFLIQKSSTTTYFTYFAQNFASSILTANGYLCFQTLFLSFFLVYTALLVLALCCVSAPILLLVPFGKGLSIGLFSAYLYAQYGFRGILTNLLLVWPQQVTCALLTIFLCYISFKESTRLFKAYVLCEPQVVATRPIRLLKLYGLCCAVTLIFTLFEAVLTSIFLPVLAL